MGVTTDFVRLTIDSEAVEICFNVVIISFIKCLSFFRLLYIIRSSIKVIVGIVFISWVDWLFKRGHQIYIDQVREGC